MSRPIGYKSYTQIQFNPEPMKKARLSRRLSQRAVSVLLKGYPDCGGTDISAIGRYERGVSTPAHPQMLAILSVFPELEYKAMWKPANKG